MSGDRSAAKALQAVVVDEAAVLEGRSRRLYLLPCRPLDLAQYHLELIACMHELVYVSCLLTGFHLSVIAVDSDMDGLLALVSMAQEQCMLR